MVFACIHVFAYFAGSSNLSSAKELLVKGDHHHGALAKGNDGIHVASEARTWQPGSSDET